MKMNINFALEEASYINTIPGKIEIAEIEGVEGKLYEFTLLEKLDPLSGKTSFKVKWGEELPKNLEDLNKIIVKNYKQMESGA
ncbi:MAG: hypothetical protein P4L27_08560 [Ignavibacteriaceae bacterium]|nr:hypothetical protein [Ignavibacteriaceae bacterium]